MTAGQSPTERAKPPIEWKLVLVTGAALGGLAGVVSLFGKEWYNWTVPAGMMVASWVAVNRAAARRFGAGFAASLLAGVLAWGLHLAMNYENLVGNGSFLFALQLTAVFLLPFILIVSVFGSWMFRRTRERVLAARQKLEAERAKERARQMERYRNRPKKKYKKKKTR